MSNKIQKMLSGFLYGLLAVILAFSVILVLPVYRKYRAKQNEVAELDRELREAQEECQNLIREVHDLENTALATERVAREKYKFCRENEEILIYK